MLRAKNRLKKRKEFSYIYRKGEVYFAKDLTLFVSKTRFNQSKVGFSVSNKVGNSVVRHKLKRRLSEIVRVRLQSFPIANYVLVAKPSAVEHDFYQLVREIENLFQKVKL